jgi:hypothetical protein
MVATITTADFGQPKFWLLETAYCFSVGWFTSPPEMRGEREHGIRRRVTTHTAAFSRNFNFVDIR